MVLSLRLNPLFNEIEFTHPPSPARWVGDSYYPINLLIKSQFLNISMVFIMIINDEEIPKRMGDITRY